VNKLSINLSKYKTIEKQGMAEVIEKKSRFIANVIPVITEEEATAFISKIKAKYWDASHNVYAYVIGNNNIQRYSDDGEPSGTAGIPVLEIIKKENLQDIVVVVTRYFGGTLLGAGGLVRAYGKSAKEGINCAAIITQKLVDILEITLEYGLLNKIQCEVSASGYEIEHAEYRENVILNILVVIDETEGFINKITDLSNGSVTINKKGQKYSCI
jgi:uncharacterized YigZ family protein